MTTLTNQIFELSSPYANPYQGSKPRHLFVCSAGLLRSPTAAKYSATYLGTNTRSCGTHNYALVPLSANLIYWADKIYFMERINLIHAKQVFQEHEDLLEMLDAKGTILGIEDDYEYDQPELLKILENKLWKL
jgi:predicted protein tyrosine phosphatase